LSYHLCHNKRCTAEEAKHLSESEYISSGQLARKSGNTEKPTDVIFAYLTAVLYKEIRSTGCDVVMSGIFLLTFQGKSQCT
jgi:hypothetical protein